MPEIKHTFAAIYQDAAAPEHLAMFSQPRKLHDALLLARARLSAGSEVAVEGAP